MATNNLYECTQDELYLVCRLGWNACSDELAEMSAFKAYYTGAYITAKLAAITAAEGLPDEQERNTTHELLRLNLVNRASDALDAWQSIKLYINKAYPDKATQLVYYDAIGQKDYRAAANYNWEKVIHLLNNGLEFIQENSSALEAGNNMPATFIADFEAMRDTIRDNVELFLNSRQVTKEDTEEKVIANNGIYRELMEMFADGSHVFRNEEAKQAKFIFSRVLEVVSPPGMSGLRVRFIALGSNVPLEGVAAVFQKEGGTEISATSDDDGRLMMELTAGVYRMSATKEGYTPVIVQYDVETGVIGNKLVVMETV